MSKNSTFRVAGGINVIFLGAFLLVPPASAQDDGKVSIGFAESVEVDPDGPRWVVCYSVDFDAKKNYVGSIIATKYRDTADNNGNVRWREKLKAQFNLDKSLYGGCNVEKSAADAQWRYGEFIKFHPSHPKELFLVDWQMKPPAAKGRSNDAGLPARPGKAVAKPIDSKPAVESPKYVEVSGPDGIIRLSPEVAERNQAAAEKYRRELEAHERAKADAKAAHDRKLAAHQENGAKAAAAMQAHEQKLAANAAEVAAHKAAMTDYKKKLAGNASTDDDPNRCITSPAIKPGLRGNTEVHVTNGCDQKVDIVICLKRTSGDWLCGARFGILSQRSMSFMSKNATGEIYVDAVTFGSKNKLGRPAGLIK